MEGEDDKHRFVELSCSIAEDNNASDSDEDLITMENITDPDSSIEIIESVAAADCSMDGIDDLVDGERMCARKCRVVVKKLWLGEMRGLRGDLDRVINLDCVEEEKNTKLDTSSDKRSIFDISLDEAPVRTNVGCAGQTPKLSAKSHHPAFQQQLLNFLLE